MTEHTFRNRRDAGRTLSGLLESYADRDDVLVLALPRGGVPVAYEVAVALRAPLDVFTVRKLGVPGREELAMGAIAGGGVIVLNEDVVAGLGLEAEIIRRVAEREGRELARREQLYRESRPIADPAGRTTIVVDDGLATGSSMRAAILALRRMKPARMVVAVPAASASTCEELELEVDEVVCATTPSPFFAGGRSYWDFAQTTDEEVRDLLRAAAGRRLGERGRDLPSPAMVIRRAAMPVREGVPSEETLFDLVRDARLVLIGEASHGTHDFYTARAAMTRRLIEQRGFRGVAVEADWPDAYRVNRYVRGRGEDATAEESMRDFQRFPTWMWRNTAVLDFVGWLREHNDRAKDHMDKTGFYGMDVYSLRRSMEEVVAFLERVDPDAAARARERYSCFDHASGDDDDESYGFAAAFGAGESCEREVVEQLVEMRRNAPEYARRDGLLAEDEVFYATRNAVTVQSATRYYRSMFGGRTASWNLRDRHMVDTIEALAEHLGREAGEPAKLVVWAHNSHLGDARSTEPGTRGELNVGQLIRQRHPGECRLIGFTTFTGTVTAADDWGAPADRKVVRPALRNSVEDLFHHVCDKEFLLRFDHMEDDVMRTARLERAIGVVYRPQTERQSHYFRARVADQFDAVIHIDETRAVEPLERTGRWERGEAPETYPFAV